MNRFITFLDNFLRGKSYFGDFIKTLIIGFLFYIAGFILIILKMLIFTSIANTQGVAILYYMILMPIVLLPIMMIYFLLLVLLRYFLSQK
mgnify:CR=1 FL=1